MTMGILPVQGAVPKFSDLEVIALSLQLFFVILSPRELIPS